MPKGDSPLLMTISREAARILRSSTVLEHQYEAMAHTIRGGRLVKGRWAFRVPLQEARDLVSWCIHQAERIAHSTTGQRRRVADLRGARAGAAASV